MSSFVSGKVDRPLVIFDGKCSFCRRWVERAKSITGESIDYAPYQEGAPRFPQIDSTAFGRAVHLIEPSGRISRGAEAVFRALKLGGRYPLLAGSYEFLPGFAWITELAYRMVATHRETADRIDMLLIGTGEQQPSYLFTRQLFLRMLGAVYLIAFASLWMQIDGLIGSRGILPVASFLSEVHSSLGNQGHWMFPTLCWFNSGDAFLHLLCGSGVTAAILLMAGIAELPMLIFLFFCYLSLVVAGQDFLSFQWDLLLLEAGFLSIFFAPARIFSCGLKREAEPSRAVLLLLRWLLFRLMFMSGVVKLASGDLSWRGWSALRFHYMTQPLPTWTSWYFFQLPPWFQTFSCGVVFLAELIVPFLIFTPRRPRLIAFWAIIAFQLLIAATGNYGFFNLLTIVLCFTLPDDTFWRWLLRRRTARQTIAAPPRWRGAITLPLAFILLLLTIPICVDSFGDEMPMPTPLIQLAEIAEPFHIANGYGLFAVMTTTRPEIIVEGSDDGRTWKPYAFKWKPGDLHRAPAFTTPYMPRLDWQMWFAALGDPSQNPWFILFLDRLKEGSAPVLRLLETNPFPDHPPRFIRAILYDYRFTDFATRRATGSWWKRKEIGIYFEAPDQPRE